MFKRIANKNRGIYLKWAINRVFHGGDWKMWRVSYIENDEIKQKGGFNSDKEVEEWISNKTNIIPLKLLVWSELLQSYRTVFEYQ